MRNKQKYTALTVADINRDKSNSTKEIKTRLTSKYRFVNTNDSMVKKRATSSLVTGSIKLYQRIFAIFEKTIYPEFPLLIVLKVVDHALR